MWGQDPLEIHHIEVRCNVEQPTKPHMTVASLRSAYFNMVTRSRTRPSGGGNLLVRGKTGTIIKCYQGIVIGRYNYAGLTGEEQVLI